MKMKDDHHHDWLARFEDELPAPDELMPLNQNLITPDLAAAFKIHRTPPPSSVAADLPVSNALPAPAPPKRVELEEEESSGGAAAGASGAAGENGVVGASAASAEEPARTLKRPRLVWTPQLHKRFVDAVAQLGIKNAVPKTIMQLMNVEGLTRENVASHLQKYRLYLKRVQGFSSAADAPPSACDHLFASTPLPPGAAAAAQFLQRATDDVVLPLVPSMLAHAAAAAHLVSAAPPPPHMHHYGSLDPRFFGALQRPPAPNQRMPPARAPQDYSVEDLGPASSPPARQVLTLFPTGEN